MITIKTKTITRKIITKLCFAAALVTLIYSCVSLPYEEGDNELNSIGATPPIAPKNVRVENESYFGAIVVWDPIDSDDLGRKINQKPANLSFYEVEYSENSGFSKSKIFASNENIFTLENLRAGARYYVRVRAINDNGTPKNTSKKSIIKGGFFSTPSIPEVMPPHNIKGAVSDLYIDLTWDSPESTGPSVDNTRQAALKSYLIRISKKDGSSTAPTQIVISGNLLAYRLSSSIGPNTIYKISIASKNDLGEVSKFASITVLTKDYIAEPPAPVTDLSSKPNLNTDTNYIISWTPPTSFGKKNSQIAAQIKAYEVYYSEDEFFPDNLTDVKMVSPSETTTEISLLRGNTNYYIKVLVRNNAGAKGLVSSAVKIQLLTEAKATAPSAPILDKRPTIDSKNINLSWSLPSRTGNSAYGEVNKGKIETYTVEYTRKSADNLFKSSPEGSEIIIVTAATASSPESRKTAIPLDDLKGDTVYFFRVYATNNYNKKSDPSNIIEVKIPSNAKGPEKVTGLSFSKAPGERGINLKWDKITHFGTKTDGITPATSVVKYMFKVYEKSGDLTVSTPIFEDDFLASANQKLINYSGKKLRPLEDYRIVLIAINEALGASEPSDPLTFTTIDTPEAPPGGVTNIATDDSKYNRYTGKGIGISWTRPNYPGKDDFGNEKDFSTIVYTMSYTKESTGTGTNTSGDFSDKTKYEIHENIPSTKASFSSLLGATTYYVQIITTNDNHVHSKSSPVAYRFTTPSRATNPNPLTPYVVTRKDLAGTALLEFTWKLPSVGSFGKATDGVKYAEISSLADAYTIRYSKVISDFLQVSDFTNFDRVALNDAPRGKQTFDKTKTKWTIQGLTPGTEYHYLMTIKSSNNLTTKYLGNTKTISGSTPPETITAASIDETSKDGELKITWDNPNSNFGSLKDGTPAQLADITSYRIYYKPFTGASYIPYGREIKSSDSREVIISGLKAYTRYEVFISPKNEHPKYSTSPPTGITSGWTKSGATKPSVPRTFKTSTATLPTKSSIGVVWSGPSDYGLKKDGKNTNNTIQYVLEYKKESVTSWSDKSVKSTTLLSTSVGTSYTVRGLSSDTTYNFRLYAVNVDDNSKKSDATPVVSSKTLSGATSPEIPGRLRLAPGNPTNPNPSSRQVILTWDPSTSNGFNRTGTETADAPRYFLEYKEKSNTKWTPTSPQLKTSFTVLNLKPFIEYEFVVKAQNSSDSSKVSGVSATLDVKTLSASSKPSLPQNIKESTTISPTPTSITISWSEARDKGKNKFGKDNDKILYTIEYKKKLDTWTSVGVKSISKIKGASGTNSSTIPNLESYTAYDFRIKSINASDDTMDSDFANLRVSLSTISGATAPSIPQNLSEDAAKTTTTEIEIKWNASTSTSAGGDVLEKDGKTPASVKYIVEYKDSKNVWDPKTMTIGETTKEFFKATGLTPGTLYYFRIKAQNADDTSKESGYSTTITPYTESAATAPSLPTAIIETKSTTTSITISWTHSANYGLDKKGILNTKSPKYTVRYRDVLLSGTWSKGDNLNDTSFQATRLSPYTKYEFQVRADNVSDSTKSSTWTIIKQPTTKAASTPPDAPTNITASDITSTRIKIHWQEPSDYGRDKKGKDNTVAPNYTVSYKKSTSTGTSWIKPPLSTSISANEYEVSGLEPFTKYDFQIIAENADDDTQKSGSLEESFKTLTAATAPSEPLQVKKGTPDPTTTSITITWDEPTSFGNDNSGKPQTTQPPKYVVRYRKVGDAFGTDSAAQTGKSFSTGTVLDSGTVYQFEVKAISSYNPSSVSGYSISPDIETASASAAPDAPSSLKLIAGTVAFPNPTTGSIAIQWSPPTSKGKDKFGKDITTNPTKYVVEYKEATVVKSKDVNVSSALATITTTITGLKKAYTEYIITVKAINPTDATKKSPVASITIRTASAATAPSEPKNIIQSTTTPATKTSLSITWEKPDSNGKDRSGTADSTEPKYLIQWKKTVDANWLSPTTGAQTTKAFTANSLASGTEYVFRIKAINALDSTKKSGYGLSTGTLKTLSGATAPGAPRVLNLTTTTTNQVAIAWNRPISFGTEANGITKARAPSYKVRYKKKSEKIWTEIKTTIPATTTSYTSPTTSPLKPFTRYEFQVKSVHADNQKIFSNYTPSLEITTLSAATAPGVPQNIRLNPTVAATSNSLSITWDAPTLFGNDNFGATITTVEPSYKVSYQEQRSTLGLTTSSTQTTKTFSANGLKPNTSYNFIVKAINAKANGKTAFAGAGFKTLSAATPPGIPTNLKKTGATSNQILISWNKPVSHGTKADGNNAGEPSYKVQYKEKNGAWMPVPAIRVPTKSAANVYGYATPRSLKASTAYEFQVKSIHANNTLESGYTTPPFEITTLSAVTPLTPPRNVRLASSTSTSLAISWDPPTSYGIDPLTNAQVTTEPLYLISYVETKGGLPIGSTSTTIPSQKARTVTITGLKSSTTYSVYIFSKNSENRSNIESVGNFFTTLAAAATPPSAPTNVRIITLPFGKPDAGGSMSITWTPPTNRGTDSSGNPNPLSAVSYKVQYREGKYDRGSFSTIPVSAGITTVTATGLTANLAYHFRVFATANGKVSTYAGETIPLKIDKIKITSSAKSPAIPIVGGNYYFNYINHRFFDISGNEISNADFTLSAVPVGEIKIGDPKGLPTLLNTSIQYISIAPKTTNSEVTVTINCNSKQPVRYQFDTYKDSANTFFTIKEMTIIYSNGNQKTITLGSSFTDSTRNNKLSL